MTEKDARYISAHDHALEPEQVLRLLGTSNTSGLGDDEVLKRLVEFGYNRIDTEQEGSLLMLFFGQFRSIVVLILAVASAISFFFRDWPEAAAILAVIFINALMGFVLEAKARHSMSALKKLDISTARVIRNGRLQEVDSTVLCIGDVISLEAGDMVAADARLLECNQLEANESMLTGESLPVNKSIEALPKNTLAAEQYNKIFKGTSIFKGNGKAVVTATGSHTALGNISSLVKKAGRSTTPLEKKLEQITRRLVWIMIMMAFIFLLTGLFQHKDLHVMLETAIALAVAAIPEGLPIVATIALAYGMMRMAKQHVIVKRLSSVETLGGTNVIFTDKTGTLTHNRITVHTLFFGDKPVVISEEKVGQGASKNYEYLQRIACLCNNADIGKEQGIGDPIEIALLVFVRSAGMDAGAMRTSFPRIAEEPFSSETKFMATLHRSGQEYFIAVKGAIEEVLKKCVKVRDGDTIYQLNDKEKRTWLSHSEKMAAHGLRVLGFAYAEKKEIAGDVFHGDLTLAGLIGFLDPPRMEVRDAISSCRKAGIKVIMVTGDHPATALNIGATVGITDPGKTAVAVHGKELQENIDIELLRHVMIYARVDPKQKLDLVKLYQAEGAIVGMTGDGVNDAPALKKADIGIAMGLRGTQIARESADIVLTDDSFDSIVNAVKQGRIIFENIRKFIVYLVSCNISEVFIVAFSSIIGLPLPLIPLQILFLNLVTDVFPALALGMGRGNDMIMMRPPRDPGLPIITTRGWQSILVYSFVLTASVLSGYLYSLYSLHLDPGICNNITFYSIAFSQLLHVFSLPSSRERFFSNDVTRNVHIWLALVFCTALLLGTYYISFMSALLRIFPLDHQSLLVIGATSILPVLLIRVLKHIRLVD